MMLLSKVHVNQVFQGAVDSIASLWLIDYANAMTIESTTNSVTLMTFHPGRPPCISMTITLTRDSTKEIAEACSSKVADTHPMSSGSMS